MHFHELALNGRVYSSDHLGLPVKQANTATTKKDACPHSSLGRELKWVKMNFKRLCAVQTGAQVRNSSTLWIYEKSLGWQGSRNRVARESFEQLPKQIYKMEGYKHDFKSGGRRNWFHHILILFFLQTECVCLNEFIYMNLEQLKYLKRSFVMLMCGDQTKWSRSMRLASIFWKKYCVYFGITVCAQA